MSLVYQGSTAVTGRRPGLYVGGKSDAKDQGKLDRCGITHILNITPTREASVQAGVLNYYQSLGRYVYKRISVYDSSSSASDLLRAADEIVDFIAAGLCHGSVLVHCNHGVSRSATAVCFFLMRRVGKSLDEAIELVKRRRPQIEPIPAFMEILRTYERQCTSQGYIGTSVTGNKKRAAVVGPSLPSENPTPEKRQRRLMIGPEFPSAVGKEEKVSRDDMSLFTGQSLECDSAKRETDAHPSQQALIALEATPALSVIGASPSPSTRQVESTLEEVAAASDKNK